MVVLVGLSVDLSDCLWLVENSMFLCQFYKTMWLLFAECSWNMYEDTKISFLLVRLLWRFWIGSVTYEPTGTATHKHNKAISWVVASDGGLRLTCLPMHQKFFQFGWGVWDKLSIIKLENRLWFIYSFFGCKVGFDHNSWVKHQHISVINNW